LADLENDVRVLKRQNRQHSPAEAAGIPSHSIATNLSASCDVDDTVVSPDATDGVGTIEFTDEKDSAYFGEQPPPAPMNSLLIVDRSVFEYRFHAKYSASTDLHTGRSSGSSTLNAEDVKIITTDRTPSI
jgi:hypothetical protein